MSLHQRGVKRNGCKCPFHPFQLASYFIALLYAYVFYFLDLVALLDYPAACYTLTAAYSCLLIAVVSIAILATLSDPTDPTIYAERELMRAGYYFFLKRSNDR